MPLTCTVSSVDLDLCRLVGRLHYTTLHYTTLHYITPHYNTLHNTHSYPISPSPSLFLLRSLTPTRARYLTRHTCTSTHPPAHAHAHAHVHIRTFVQVRLVAQRLVGSAEAVERWGMLMGLLSHTEALGEAWNKVCVYPRTHPYTHTRSYVHVFTHSHTYTFTHARAHTHTQILTRDCTLAHG